MEKLFNKEQINDNSHCGERQSVVNNGKPAAVQYLFSSEWTMIEIVIESLGVYN